MLNSWRIFCKTYSRITVQIIHGLNDIGTEILVIRNKTIFNPAAEQGKLEFCRQFFEQIYNATVKLLSILR